MKRGILDKSFKYVPSYATDIRERFRRIRKQQRSGLHAVVVDIRRKNKGEPRSR